MRRLLLSIGMLTVLMSVVGCTGNGDQRATDQGALAAGQQTATVSDKVSGEPCDITIAGIHFTKSVNQAAQFVTTEQGKTVFKAGERTDYFSDPNGRLSNTTAPLLLSKVDNTKPFTFTAKVTPKFGELYNAGVLYVYVHDLFFQKLCFEQDERGHHRIVSVRTQGTSDDNNHDIVTQPYVYMKVSSDAHTIASYYSLDGKQWQLVRLYENNYPGDIWLGISTQCPQGSGTESTFEDLQLSATSVADFRMGI